MRVPSAQAIVADVRASDLLDRLVVTPRYPAHAHTLSGALRSALPGVRLHRSADGVWVGSQDADALLAADVMAELHWSPEAERFAQNRRRVKRAQHRLREEVGAILAGG